MLDSTLSPTYRTVPKRRPQKADARVFRAYWHKQRRSHRPLRDFMRQLAHDYWIAKRYGA